MARNFTTTTDKVSITHNAALNILGNVTLYCWVYLNAGSVYHSLVSKAAGNGETPNENPYDLSTNNAASPVLVLRRSDSLGGGIKNSTFTLSTGVWTHVAASDTANGAANSCKLYKNAGTPDLLTACNLADPVGNTKPVLIGERDDARGGNCAIGWVGIHNVILTQEEISEAMLHGFTSRGLVDCWALFGDVTEADLSGNARNGAVTGTTVVAGPPVLPPWYRSVHETMAAFKNELPGYPGQNYMLGNKSYHTFLKTPKKTGTTGREGFNLKDLTP